MVGVKEVINRYQRPIYTISFLLVINLLLYLMMTNLQLIIDNSSVILSYAFGALILIFFLVFLVLNLTTLFMGLISRRNRPSYPEYLRQGKQDHDNVQVEYVYLYINKSTIPENDYSLSEREME